MAQILAVKLGGSIITSKKEGEPEIKREVILRLAQEIKAARTKKFFDLILVHGVGSFGHGLAKKYKLWEGLKNKSQIIPFAQTQAQTITLNHHVLEIFHSVGLPVMGVNPTTIILQKDKNLLTFETRVIKHLLDNHFIPVLYGTIVQDKNLTFSICSGDTILMYLAKKFNAQKAIFCQ
ncbi:hypothetical protein HY404_03525 [Candidatus Microgenomates bacterium]|nr:hypothetical protein [Candidatus Microgenomates bacterium]